LCNVSTVVWGTATYIRRALQIAYCGIVCECTPKSSLQQRKQSDFLNSLNQLKIVTMEYEIQIVTPHSGKIMFKWEEVKSLEGEPMTIPYSKSIAFTITPTQCYVPEIVSRTWAGFGERTIKSVMCIPETACCCNPDHVKDESMAIEFGKSISKEVHPEIKQEEIVPTKEKIEEYHIPEVGLISDSPVDLPDRRKKLTDGEVDMIRNSPKGNSELARLFGVSRGHIHGIKSGRYR
jgi:hypothetical protein